MTYKKNIIYILLGLLSTFIISSNSAQASQTWSTFCSNASASSSKQTANSFNTSNYVIQAVDTPSVQLKAEQMIATQSGLTLSADQLQRITHITSTGLLTIILKHKLVNCNKNYYKDTLTPALNSLQTGGNITFLWKNIKFKDQTKSYRANNISLQISGQENKLHVIIRFSGFVNLKQSSNVFLPQQGQVDATTTPQAYPLIMAANSGDVDQTYIQNIPVTVNSFNISNNMTNITAQGNVNLNQRLNVTSGKGKVRIANIQKLISASDKSGVNKLKTTLTLAKFAGKSVNNNTLEWDINFQGNLLKVNGIPIPVW